MNLTIKRIGPEDYGSYKCISKNSLGGTDGNIKLYKTETPTTTPTTTTTTKTTTTTIRPSTTVKVENRKRIRPKPSPTIPRNYNEIVDTSESTANEKRGAQLLERPNTDTKIGKKRGNHDTMQPDKTAQSMSSKSAAILSFTYSNAAVFAILFTALLW